MKAPKNIPEEYKDAYQRLMGSLPDKIRNDPKIQKTTLVFLKFGGEALARHSVEINRIRFKEEMKRIKKRLREEALRKAAKAQEQVLEAHDSSDKAAQDVSGSKKTDGSS